MSNQPYTYSVLLGFYILATLWSVRNLAPKAGFQPLIFGGGCTPPRLLDAITAPTPTHLHGSLLVIQFTNHVGWPRYPTTSPPSLRAWPRAPPTTNEAWTVGGAQPLFGCRPEVGGQATLAGVDLWPPTVSQTLRIEPGNHVHFTHRPIRFWHWNVVISLGLLWIMDLVYTQHHVESTCSCPITEVKAA